MRAAFGILVMLMAPTETVCAQDPVRTISPKDNEFYDRLALSPDGKNMILVGRKRIRMLDFATGQELPCKFERLDDWPSANFSVDGKFMAIASGAVVLYDFPSEKRLIGVGSRGLCMRLRFTPDSKAVIAFGSEGVRAWDLTQKEGFPLLYDLPGPTYLGGSNLSPDGKLIAYISGPKVKDGSFAIYRPQDFIVADALTGKPKKIIPLDKDKLFSQPPTLIFSRDSKVIVTAGEHFRFWEWETDKELARIVGSGRLIAQSPDGKLAAYLIGDAFGFGLLDLDRRRIVGRVMQSQQELAVPDIAFSADGQQLVSAHMGRKVGTPGIIKIWNVAKLVEHLDAIAATRPKVRATLGGDGEEPFISVVYSSDGRYLASFGQNAVGQVWDSATGKNVLKVKCTSLVFGPDNKSAIAAGSEGEIQVWDLASGKMSHSFKEQPDKGQAEALSTLALSPDGKSLAAGSKRGNIRLWDLGNRAELAKLTGHKLSVERLMFTPDGKTLISLANDHTIGLWDVASCQRRSTIKAYSSYQCPMAVTSDSSRLAFAIGKQIEVWNPTNGRQLAVLPGHGQTVTALAYSPDGTVLASGCDNPDFTVALWDAGNNNQLKIMKGHTNVVRALTFAPDGKSVFSASHDRTIRIWNVATGESMAVLLEHTGFVTSVAFSPRGSSFVSASEDRTIQVFEMPSR